MKSRKRGISEIISAVLVIAIVVAGMGIYVVASQQRILGDTLSLKETIQMSQDQTSELLEEITMTRTKGEPADVLSLFLINYGTKNVTITDVFVNGTKNMTDLSYIRTLDKVNQTEIPVGKSIELVVNFTTSLDKPDKVNNIVLITDSRKFIEFENKTE